MEFEGFAAFWDAYPRKVAKEAAKRMYSKALKLTTPREIYYGVERYRREVAGKEMQFIAHPATWLNGGRWGDYPAPTKSTLASGFYAAFTSPEREAWDAYGLATRGRDYPKDKQGGWYFPTRWPPGHLDETRSGPAREHPYRG